jgi:hypothetical protein
MDLGPPSSRPARSRLAPGSPSAASAAAAADLQSHRAAAVRFACPDWAWLLRPAAQERVVMPSPPASGMGLARVCLVWCLQARKLEVRGMACLQVQATACLRPLAQLPVAVLVACE